MATESLCLFIGKSCATLREYFLQVFANISIKGFRCNFRVLVGRIYLLVQGPELEVFLHCG